MVYNDHIVPIQTKIKKYNNMTIADQIERIEDAADKIKAKTEELGLDKKDGSGKVSASDNITIQADAIDGISKGTPVSEKLTSSKSSISLPKGYYGSASTVSADIMQAPSVSLSGQVQTISCKDKMMSDDITIPAANVYMVGYDEPTSMTPGNNGDLYLVI